MQVSASQSSYMYNNSFTKVNDKSNPSQNEEQKVVGLNEKENPTKTTSSDDTEKKDDKKSKTGLKELTQAEKQQVSKLQARDAEVRAHEAAHLAAAGGTAAGGASFTYQKGPDGKQYAIGGEVPIDMSKGSTPEATIAKMQQVKAAATAPANPSGQDMKVAATAAVIEMQARQELSEKKNEELKEKATEAYTDNNSQEEKEKQTTKTETQPLDLSA